MKFGATLRQSQISEWERAYIDYRKLKKAIHRAQDELEGTFSPPVTAASPSSVRTSSSRRTSTVSARQLEEAAMSGTTTAVDGEAADDEGEEDDSGALTTKTAQSRPSDSPDESQDPAQDEAVSQSRVKLFIPQRQRSETLDPSSAGPYTPGGTRRRRGTLTLSGDFNPRRWRRGFDNDMKLREVLERCPPQSKRFFHLLDRELDRVCSFYAEREDEYQRRFDELRLNWQQLKDHREIHHVCPPHSTAASVLTNACQEIISRSPESARTGPARHDTSKRLSGSWSGQEKRGAEQAIADR